MSQGDFFEEDDQQNAVTQQAAKKRRRTRTIALVALGGVTALGVYACMRTDEEERVVQQANADAGVPGVDAANGQQQQTQHRNSYFPWFWMMSRGGMFGGNPAPVPGATSGFNSGGGTATAGRAGTSTPAPSSTSTSRGGFGAFGRALSGLS